MYEVDPMAHFMNPLAQQEGVGVRGKCIFPKAPLMPLQEYLKPRQHERGHHIGFQVDDPDLVVIGVCNINSPVGKRDSCRFVEGGIVYRPIVMPAFAGAGDCCHDPGAQVQTLDLMVIGVRDVKDAVAYRHALYMLQLRSVPHVIAIAEVEQAGTYKGVNTGTRL